MGLNSGRRYTITLSVNAMNALNHPNCGTPDGNLSSPFSGRYVTLAGGFGPVALEPLTTARSIFKYDLDFEVTNKGELPCRKEYCL
jgi:hypothetical protein